MTIGTVVVYPQGLAHGVVIDGLAGMRGVVGAILEGSPRLIRVDYGRDSYYHLADEVQPVAPAAS